MLGENGEATCRTPSGRRCTACCVALKITSLDTRKTTLKEAGISCPARIPLRGCAHVITGRPGNRFQVCRRYHCSSDLAIVHDSKKPKGVRLDAYSRLFMILNAALAASEISPEQYRQDRTRIGENPTTITLERGQVYTLGQDNADEIAQMLIDRDRRSK